MALSKSALSELLDALRAGGDLDVIREGLALVLQALASVSLRRSISELDLSAMMPISSIVLPMSVMTDSSWGKVSSTLCRVSLLRRRGLAPSVRS